MVGRGRQKTELKLIEKKESRLVCFSKRRSGLFKKARELSILSGAKIGAIVFSPAGKPCVLEAQTLDSLLGCQLEKDDLNSSSMESKKEAPFWWDRPLVEGMSYEELLQFQRAMLEYREKQLGKLVVNFDHDVLQGKQQGQDEPTLIDPPNFSCNKDSADPTSLELQMQMFSSTFDPNSVFDEQWLQWLDDWLID